MKQSGIFTLIIFVLAGIGFSRDVYAFHSGGVAECEGCHTIHNSIGGAQATTAFPLYSAGSYLLKGTDQSSTCLNCHQRAGDIGPMAHHVSTAEADMPPGLPPLQLCPGGDFGWIKKTYSWISSTGAPVTSAGERRGHNVVAVNYNYNADITLTAAPGGTYPSANLSCISCHDPHGKYRRDNIGVISSSGKPIRNSGSYDNSQDPDALFTVGVYRLLGGIAYQPKSLVGGFPFVFDPPAAVAPSTYNRSEASTQTRVAYGRGMSEWCANCHTSLHNSTFPATQIHPAGNGAKLGATISANYNAYIKTGDLTGTIGSSYLSLTPYEEGIGDQTIASYSQLKTHAKSDDSQLAGPDASNANVMCLSCHRSHASAFESITRFSLGNEFMTSADSGGTAIYADPTVSPDIALGLSVVETQKAYYDRPASKFAPFQRVLCNKCHVMD